MNRFEGKNAINFFRWVILRKDNYDQIVFYFLSRRNTTSSRYYPLFNASKEVRVVVLPGLKLPFTDVFMLKIFWSLVYLFRKKISKYRVIHTFSSEIKFNCLYQVLHLDDPEYSNKCINEYCSKDTDKRIVYELVKLGCKINKDSKYYNDYKNIQIISNNS